MLPEPSAHPHLVDGGEEVLVTQGERLVLAKVKVLGVVVHQLGLGGAHGLGASLGDAVKAHIALT